MEVVKCLNQHKNKYTINIIDLGKVDNLDSMAIEEPAVAYIITVGLLILNRSFDCFIVNLESKELTLINFYGIKSNYFSVFYIIFKEDIKICQIMLAPL